MALEPEEMAFIQRAQGQQRVTSATTTTKKLTQAASTAKAEATRYVQGNVTVVLDGLLAPLSGPLTILANALSKLYNNMDDLLAQAQKALVDQLEKSLANLGPSLASAVGGVMTAVTLAIDSFMGNLATLDDIVQVVRTAIRKDGPALQEWAADALSGGVGIGLLTALTGLEAETPEAVLDALAELEASPFAPAEVKALARFGKAKQAPVAAIVLTLVVGVLLIPFLGAVFTPAIEGTRAWAWSKLPILPAAPAELAQARLMGHASKAVYDRELSRQGLGAEMAELLWKNREGTLPPLQAVQAWRRGALDESALTAELGRSGVGGHRAAALIASARPVLPDRELTAGLLRGVMSEAEHDGQLRAQGYTPVEIAWRKALYQVLPGPQDLIRMAVREVFDPAQRRELDLDADFPQDFAVWAERQGLSEEWARNYWAAHWELPSPFQAYEMLHRGLIGEDDLARLLRAADYAPKWRPLLQAIAYAPLTRVDVRRMHRLGILTEAEVDQAYRAIGYNAENARRLTEFTVALNTEEQAAAIEPFRASLKGRIVTAFINAVVGREEARKAFESLGYAPAEVEAFLAEAEFVRTFEAAQDVRDTLRKEYVAGLITWENATAQLAQIGFGPEEIAAVEPVWKEQRDHRALSDVEREARDLTKAEVLAAFRERVLTGPELDAALAALGYDERERAVLTALENAKAQKEVSTALRGVIQSRFVRGLITRQAAELALDGIGVGSAHKEALLARWEADKIKAGERVPPATIRQLLREKRITKERATELLSGQGWPPDVEAAVIAGWQAGSQVAVQA